MIPSSPYTLDTESCSHLRCVRCEHTSHCCGCFHFGGIKQDLQRQLEKLRGD